jgi:DNA-binding NtrC family response regulator
MTTLSQPLLNREPEHPSVHEGAVSGVEEQQRQLLLMLHGLTDKLGKAPLKSLVNETVGLVERHYIEAALETTDGNRSAAAKMLGLSRQSLYMKLARYGIGVED